MKKNVGKIDKSFRIVLGLGLLSLLFVLNKPNGYIGLVGIVPLLTAFVGRCPLYTIFGFSTCSVKNSRN